MTEKGTSSIGEVTKRIHKTLKIDDGENLDSESADAIKSAGVVIPQRIIATANVPGGGAAADYDGLFFIADGNYQVVSIKERHAAAGTDAGAVTLMVKKVPSGTAKSAGTDTLASGINLKAIADTNQTGTLHATTANYQLAEGDSLGLVPTGVLTTVDGVTVTVELKRI